MAFEHKNRGAGDVILSADWNAMGDEIQRVGKLLEQDEKEETVTLPVPLRVFGKGSPRSPLSVAGGAAIGSGYADRSPAPENGLLVEGSTGVGTPTPAGKLHVVHQEQDAGGNALVLGPDTGSNLRLGYHKDYSWIQSHGSRPLKINPLGNDVSIGTQVVVQGDGDVGIGTQAPQARLHVEGNALLNGGLTVKESVQFVNKTRQMLNLWGQDYGIGIQGSTQYYRTAGHFAWYRGGAHHDAALNPGGGTPQMVLRDNGFLGIGTAAPTARLEVAGVVKAQSVVTTNPLVHRMFPPDPIVYRDIFDAKNRVAIRKLGNPNYDETTHASNLWAAQKLIRFGGKNETDGNGAELVIPAGYDTAWVRVLGDRWTVFKAYFTDGAKEDLGLWAGGYRSTNGYGPDGSLSDGYNAPDHGIEGGSKLRVDLHQWVPIPAGRAGTLALVAKPNTNWDFWLSGVAFSRNPWAHATRSAVAYHWALNGGTALGWETHDWYQDVLAQILPKVVSELIVPVIPTGRDKLLYLVEHNNSWNGCGHTGISVNGRPIERFLATYDNPFARHWNSKFYNRYIAARIPADLVGNERSLRVSIDLGKQNSPIYFREAGTHDLDVPLTT